MKSYSYTEVIELVPGLDEPLLFRLIEAQIVLPMRDSAGTQAETLREADVARLRLCCDLCESFGLEDDSLALVMDLVDEMHGLRGELRALMGALAEEEDAVQQRIKRRIVIARGQ